jgi:hypothetical protein
VVVYLYLGVQAKNGRFNAQPQGKFLKDASSGAEDLYGLSTGNVEGFVERGLEIAVNYPLLPEIKENHLRRFHALARDVWNLLQSPNEEGPPPVTDNDNAS